MGLKSDFNEVISDWRSAPWRVRLWLGLSLFLASGSIASLSETIAKWKGFILSGVDFYRQTVANPFSSLVLKTLGYQVSADLTDALVLGSLLLSAYIKVAIHKAGSSGGKAEAIAGTIVFVVIVLAIVAWSSPSNAGRYLLSLAMSFVVFSSLRFNKIGGATRILWFGYIIGPLMLIGIAASINIGLK